MLVLLLALCFAGAADDDIKREFTGMRYGELKKRVADMVIAHLEPFQERYRRIVSEPGYLDGILRAGAERGGPIYARIWIDQDMKKRTGY